MVREKEIQGLPGYFIRDDGTIRTVTGIITRGQKTHCGYRTFTARVVGKRPRKALTRRMHRLVARVWCHNPRVDIFDCVDHIDGNKDNNSFINLRWLNRRLNSFCRRASGVCPAGNKFCVRISREYCGGPYDTREEADAASKRIRAKMFEKMYAEELAREPPFKSVGTQCTLLE
jgi:hypothetical protein